MRCHLFASSQEIIVSSYFQLAQIKFFIVFEGDEDTLND